MKDRGALDRLARIGCLVRDVALAEAARAARAREESRALLSGLASTPAPEDLPLVASALADLQYQRWVERRRAEVNLVLARQTAEWMEARNVARQAFGRAEALRRLSEKR